MRGEELRAPRDEECALREGVATQCVVRGAQIKVHPQKRMQEQIERN